MGLRQPWASGDGNPPAAVPLAPAPTQADEVEASKVPVVDLSEGPSQGEVADDEPTRFTAGAQPWETEPDVFPAAAASNEAWARSAALPAPIVLRPAPYQVTHGGTRMREVIADVPTTAWQLAQAVCADNFFPWQLRTREDHYVSPHHILQPGDILRFSHVDSAEGISLPLAFMMPLPDQVPELQRPAISCLARARLLHLQKDRLAVDQIDYVLREISRASPCPLVVIDTPLLLSAVQHQSHEVLATKLREIRLSDEFGVIGAILAWMCSSDSVAAWHSFAPRVADNCIGTANCVIGRAVQRTLSQFRFLHGPVRPLNGPHCGRFALADLRSLIMSTPFQTETAILANSGDLPAGLLPPSQNGLVPLPTCIASGRRCVSHLGQKRNIWSDGKVQCLFVFSQAPQA